MAQVYDNTMYYRILYDLKYENNCNSSYSKKKKAAVLI